MDVLRSLRRLSLLPLFLFLTGCQLGYYWQSATGQMSLLNRRVSVEKSLQDPNLSAEDKRKLQLAQRAREFASGELHLKQTDNYKSFVKLDRPYVTYVVSASPKWELKHHLWDYAFVGKMPYKGFFNEKDALAEEETLKQQDLDTYLRGVSAYSTLGWFNDPLLSSMLTYDDDELVNTIIHETVHATLYIKNSADFNERMAVFMGNKGTELFYLKEEGVDSPTLKKIKLQNADDRLFSEFISHEITKLEQWYESNPARDEDKRLERIRQIQEHFQKQVAPHLKTKSYARFPSAQLNNARLLIYKTYMQDLSDFEKAFDRVGGDFAKFIELCRKLEKSPHPEEEIGTPYFFPAGKKYGVPISPR